MSGCGLVRVSFRILERVLLLEGRATIVTVVPPRWDDLVGGICTFVVESEEIKTGGGRPREVTLEYTKADNGDITLKPITRGVGETGVELTADSKLEAVADIVHTWARSVGQDRCHYHPELFKRIAGIVGVDVEQAPDIPQEQMERGCIRYVEGIYGDTNLCIRDRFG